MYQCKDCRRKAARQRETLQPNGYHPKNVPPLDFAQTHAPYPPANAFIPSTINRLSPLPQPESKHPNDVIQQTVSAYLPNLHRPPEYPYTDRIRQEYHADYQSGRGHGTDVSFQETSADRRQHPGHNSNVSQPTVISRTISASAPQRSLFVQGAVPHSPSHPFAPLPFQQNRNTANNVNNNVSYMNGQPRQAYLPPQQPYYIATAHTYPLHSNHSIPHGASASYPAAHSRGSYPSLAP